MRYDQNDRESGNVEDRREEGGGGGFRFRAGAAAFRFPMGGGGFSLTTLLIIGAMMLFMGINPLDVLLGGGGGGGPCQHAAIAARRTPGHAAQSNGNPGLARVASGWPAERPVRWPGAGPLERRRDEDFHQPRTG